MTSNGASANPWVARPDATPAQPAVDSTVHATPATGPDVCQSDVSKVAGLRGLPHRDVSAGASLWIVGAHGGAGESTIAQLVAGWKPAQHAWPTTQPTPAAVLLVARTSVLGLRAAQHAMIQWASGDTAVDLLGLAVIADAPGQLPRPLRDYLQLLAGGVSRLWRIGWNEAWRQGQRPRLDGAPKPVRRLARDLDRLLVTRPVAAGDPTLKG